jgi:hypothetical protein
MDVGRKETIDRGDFLNDKTNIVTWDLNDKIVIFFLEHGTEVNLESVKDVWVYPKAKEDRAE